jgi:predicted nucleic acid-binding Zn ribbon protein
MCKFHGQIICYDRAVIKANQVMPAVVAEVIRKAPLTDAKVAFAWRLAVGPAVAKATTVRLATDGTLYVNAESKAWVDSIRASVGLIRSRLAHYLGEDAVKRISYPEP